MVHHNELIVLKQHMMQAGLKTGMYYLRTRAAADAIKFTVDQQALARSKAARAVVAVPAVADNVLKVRPLRALLHQYSNPHCYMPCTEVFPCPAPNLHYAWACLIHCRARAPPAQPDVYLYFVQDRI